MTTTSRIVSVDLGKHPDLLAKLQRPVNGQGGFQSLLRQLQAAFKITPRIDDGSRTRTAVTAAAPMRAATATRSAIVVNATGDLAGRIDALRAEILGRATTAESELQSAREALQALNGSAPIVAGKERKRTATVDVDDTDTEPIKARKHSSRKRRAAMKASWANLSPKERKAHVAKMAAGRSKARH